MKLSMTGQEKGDLLIQVTKGVAYVEATEAAASVKNICKKKYVKTIKLYFHVLNKGTINKLTD